jgi:hypothetical protein
MKPKSSNALKLPVLFGLLVVWMVVDRASATESTQTEPRQPTSTFAQQLVTCATRELGALTTDEQALLIESAPDLERELSFTISPDACSRSGPVSASCKAALNGVSCESLAVALSIKGYDQYQAPALDPALLQYVSALSKRALTCVIASPNDDLLRAMSAIASERLELAAATALATRCVLQSERVPVCLERIEKIPCTTLGDGPLDLEQVLQLCDDLFQCTPAGPAQ